MKTFPILRAKRIQTDSDQKEMIAVFQRVRGKDNVYPMGATHIACLGDEIVGGFSVQTPTVYWWTDPEQNSIRLSLQMIGCVETIMSERGTEAYIIACEEESPYYKILEKHLSTIKGENGCDKFKLFIRDMR